MPQPVMPKKLKLNGSVKNYKIFWDQQPKKYVHFIIGDWNAKVGSQEIPGVTGKFAFGAQNDAGQSLTEFCQENALIIANILFRQYKR